MWWPLDLIYLKFWGMLSRKFGNPSQIGVIQWPLNIISTEFWGISLDDFGKYDENWCNLLVFKFNIWALLRHAFQKFFENLIQIGVIFQPLHIISTKFRGMPSETFGKYE